MVSGQCNYSVYSYNGFINQQTSLGGLTIWSMPISGQSPTDDSVRIHSPGSLMKNTTAATKLSRDWVGKLDRFQGPYPSCIPIMKLLLEYLMMSISGFPYFYDDIIIFQIPIMIHVDIVSLLLYWCPYVWIIKLISQISPLLCVQSIWLVIGKAADW